VQSRSHSQCGPSLLAQVVIGNFNQLRKTFPSAGLRVPSYTIFNISGNKYRFSHRIDYDAHVSSIKANMDTRRINMPKTKQL